MVNRIFSDILLNSGSRIVSKPDNSKVLLDKNEQPDDLENNIKQKVLEELKKRNWNRYPEPDNVNLESLIAQYTGLEPANIAVGPGTAYIITALLNYFAINQLPVIIAQPSYTLFDYHCKTYGINYTPWYLNDNLDFDPEKLPDISEKSVIIVASPNNPVGNILSTQQFENILQHPHGPLVILDAVYLEFSEIKVNFLLNTYQNLIILRSFSKAFPAAGIRLGYVCTSAHIASILKKLILMFSVNHFTQICASVILSNPAYLQKVENRILAIKNERDNVYRKLTELGLEVRSSEGNFLLVKIRDNQLFNRFMQMFADNGIKILNTSNLPMLENTFRISIGSIEENKYLLNSVKKILI